MQINVSQLLKADIGTTRNHSVNALLNTADSDSTGSKVWGEVSLMRTDRSILVKGVLHTEVKVTCSRCLNLFSHPLILNMEEEYFPTVDTVSGAFVNVPGEPGCFLIDEQHVLDLTEAIRQYALMAIPMKPLCRPGCAGLCPECGQNLNRGACGCHCQQVDTRWESLTRLTAEQKGTD